MAVQNDETEITAKRMAGNDANDSFPMSDKMQTKPGEVQTPRSIRTTANKHMSVQVKLYTSGLGSTVYGVAQAQARVDKQTSRHCPAMPETEQEVKVVVAQSVAHIFLFQSNSR